MFDYLNSNSEKKYVNVEEKDKLVQFLKEEHGLDLSNYAEASVRRRIAKILNELRLNSVDEYIQILKEEENPVDYFTQAFTVNVTEMFRDPFCYEALLRNTFDLFTRLDKIRVWVAGCSTGEEALSLAILLKETGVLERCDILATDISNKALAIARDGRYKLRHIEKYASTYTSAGGKYQLEDYYAIESDQMVRFDQELLAHTRFKQHNLLDIPPEGDFDLVVCRNVLIYFNPNLQHQVLGSLTNALVPHGDLFIGSKETILFYQDKERLREVEPEVNLYRKV